METDEALESLARRIASLEAFLAQQGYRAEHPTAPRLSRTMGEESLVHMATPPQVSTTERLSQMRRAVAESAAVAGHHLPPPLAKPIPVTREPVDPAPSPPSSAVPIAQAVSISSPEPSPQPVALPYAVPLPRAEVVASTNFEQAIGLKVAGWIGAIVVVIGAAMGVKFAYDQGWLGGMSDQAKLSLLYAAGLAIIGAGEWVYRRVDPRAAVGVYAAGIACLFVVGYAGSTYFNLYEQATAFALMAAACGVGALIALRGGFVSIAVLSLIGANVAPVILRGTAVGEVPLLAYLLALQVMAVGLAHIGGGGRWWILRSLALLTTSLWVAARLVQPATAHSLPTITFAAIYVAVFQLELVLFALRSDARRTADERPVGDRLFSVPTFSLAVTGFLIATVLAWTSYMDAPIRRGSVLMGLAMLAAVAGAATVSARGAAMRSLATSWLTQAALLLVIAVPVSLNGPAITLAWGGLAVAYAVLGFVIARRRTLYAGAAVWAVACAHLTVAVFSEKGAGQLHSAFATINGVGVPTYLAIAVLLGLAGHGIALLAGALRFARDENDRRTGAVSLADVLAIAATATWAVALLAALPPLGATVGLLLVAWTLLAIGTFFKRALYVGGSVAVVLLALAKWAAIDVLGERLGTGAAAHRHVLFNAPMAIGATCAASLAAMLWLTRKSRAGNEERALTLVWAAVIAAVVAVTVGLSIEVERAVRHAAASATPLWPPTQSIAFGWTLLWLAAVHVPALIARTIDPSRDRHAIAWQGAVTLTILLGLKFIFGDSIYFAVTEPRVPAMAAVNLHTLTALTVVVMIFVSSRRRECVQEMATTLRAMLFAVPLVVGSIELDRQLGPERTLIAWSAFWGAYAIGSIVLGFALRSASFRFAGLGLLGVTLLKIVLVDLASAGTGWRILSFLAVGIVLLITSVLYGKLSPRLLGEHTSPSPP